MRSAKSFLIIILIFFVKLSLAQKKDPFTGQIRWESKYATIAASGFSAVQCKVITVDSSAFLELNGQGAGNHLISDHPLIFLMQDNSTISLFPTEMQTGGATVYHHMYRLPKYELELLSRQPIKSMRKNTAAGYSDFEVKQKHASKLQLLFKNSQQIIQQ